MIDVSYFQNSTSNTQIFQSGGTWQTWIKPRNAKTVNLFVVGAGAGGGGGRQLATGNKSGGGGGANGGNVKLTVLASILPDILYILPGTGGNGGVGGAPGTAGDAATKSFVTLSPDTGSISNIVCTSGAVAAQGGPAGSTIAVAGGVAETVATIANMVFANLGNFLADNGVGGGSGGLTTGAGAAVNEFTINSGGGGGTGTGGGLTGGGPFPTIAATPINTSGTGGLIFYEPIFGLTGGRGGGGGTTGGNGGDGAPGCGGGGGGAGTVSAGNGGRGGDGFVIITTNF